MSQLRKTASPSSRPAIERISFLHRVGHELGDGPLARAVHEGDVAKAGRAQALGVRDHAVEEAARLARGPLDRNSAHDAPFGDGALEGLEGDRVARELLGEVDNLDGDAQIRLVGAVAQHRILVGEAREGRPGDGALGELREDAVHDRLQRLEHVLLLDEGHLDVELVELAGGAVGAGVLVAEAGRDLEVAVEAGGHDQLLELLRRLRQGVEGAGMEPARHQEVARALGRARGQDRRVALHEAQVHHVPADAGDDRAAPHHVLVHALAPEVEEAVAEPHLLAVVVLAVDGQRQGLGGVLHLSAAMRTSTSPVGILEFTVSSSRVTTGPVTVTTVSGLSAVTASKSGSPLSETHSGRGDRDRAPDGPSRRGALGIGRPERAVLDAWREAQWSLGWSEVWSGARSGPGPNRESTRNRPVSSTVDAFGTN